MVDSFCAPICSLRERHEYFFCCFFAIIAYLNRYKVASLFVMISNVIDMVLIIYSTVLKCTSALKPRLSC